MRRTCTQAVAALSLGCALTLPLTSTAAAVPIVFAFDGFANGSLGGSPFSNAGFHVRVTADTANIVPLNEPGYTVLGLDDDRSTIQIGTFPTATFSEPLRMFDNKTNSILGLGTIRRGLH